MFHFPVALGLLLLAGFLAVPVQAQDPEAQARHEQELAQVRARMQALGGTIEANKGRQDALQQEVEDAERLLAEAVAQVRRLRVQIDAQQRRLRETEKQQRQAEEQLAEHHGALALQVRAAYIIGKQGHTKLLLNQQDAQRLGRVMVYYEYLNRARAGRIQMIQGQLASVRALAERLKSEAAALAGLRQEQDQALIGLRTSYSQRSAALKQIKRTIRSELAQLGALQENEKEIQRLLGTLREALVEIPLQLDRSDKEGDPGDKPFPALKGRLPWPLRGKMLANYGEPKAGGKLSWNGLWIDSSEGDPVRAVARGRVAYVGWMQRYGLIVILEHESGYFTLYGHAQTVAKVVGDEVAAGEVIAAAGSSGGHERAGLYFEVRKGTQPQDPGSWLDK